MRYKGPTVTLYIVEARRPQTLRFTASCIPRLYAEARDFAKSINLIKARVDNSGYARVLEKDKCEESLVADCVCFPNCIHKYRRRRRYTFWGRLLEQCFVRGMFNEARRCANIARVIRLRETGNRGMRSFGRTRYRVLSKRRDLDSNRMDKFGKISLTNSMIYLFS